MRVKCELDSREKNEYYQNIRFRIYCKRQEDKERELVDGGIVDWTQKFLNNAKERLIISGIGSERLCKMRTNIFND